VAGEVLKVSTPSFGHKTVEYCCASGEKKRKLKMLALPPMLESKARRPIQGSYLTRKKKTEGVLKVGKERKTYRILERIKVQNATCRRGESTDRNPCEKAKWDKKSSLKGRKKVQTKEVKRRL